MFKIVGSYFVCDGLRYNVFGAQVLTFNLLSCQLALVATCWPLTS